MGLGQVMLLIRAQWSGAEQGLKTRPIHSGSGWYYGKRIWASWLPLSPEIWVGGPQQTYPLIPSQPQPLWLGTVRETKQFYEFKVVNLKNAFIVSPDFYFV